MSDQTNQQDTTLYKVKSFLKDYLWFILLLAPLAMMPLLIVEKTKTKSRRDVSVVKQTQTKLLTKSIEISSAEVAEIVAKPISALLKMNVYVNQQQAANNTLMMQSIGMPALYTSGQKVISAQLEIDDSASTMLLSRSKG